jgi:hypothetical protein
MSPMCPLKPAWRIGMELLVSVEADDVINWGENESDSKRGCWDTEGRISVLPIESWYGSYNITHCRAHVIRCAEKNNSGFEQMLGRIMLHHVMYTRLYIVKDEHYIF